MDRYRSYNGRSTSRRRHSSSSYPDNSRTAKRAIKLFICAGLFIIAAGMKLLFPSALNAVGEKINSVVNYKAAFTAIGQGISGEKKFTTALGEAFTYAFTGEPASEVNKVDPAQASDDKASAATSASDSAAGDDAAAVFSEDDSAGSTPASSSDAPAAVTDTGASATDAGVSATNSKGNAADADATASDDHSLSNAVVAAFLQSQEQYSDYAIPAGVTYEMPRISIDYAKPVAGVVSSTFGYRIHPTEKTVKFHYGTDIAAKKGTPITAFADGKVLSTGENSSYGKYVILSHGDIESEYAHCSSINVSSGQTVKKGDKIAAVGDTGNATETCLHFELKVNGQYVNPEYYVQWK